MTQAVSLRFPDGKIYDIIADMERLPLVPVFVAMRREQRFGNLLAAGIDYSVLHHSLLVASITKDLGGSKKAVCGAMIHDVHEGAGLRDLPSPVKAAMRAAGDTGYFELCAAFDRALEKRLGLELTAADREVIKAADEVALRIEQTVFQWATTAKPNADLEPEAFAAFTKGLKHLELVGESCRGLQEGDLAISFGVTLSDLLAYADGADIDLDNSHTGEAAMEAALDGDPFEDFTPLSGPRTLN